MSDPDLATSISKPNVVAAIAECTKNPMAILKYQSDPEVGRADKVVYVEQLCFVLSYSVPPPDTGCSESPSRGQSNVEQFES